ncbi:MAG: manganese efflux pump [Acetivibrio ethanolgignens]
MLHKIKEKRCDEMLWLGILPITLSIDALGIGFSYRMRGIKITREAKLLISCLTGLFMAAAMIAGQLLSSCFPGEVMKLLGTALLALIGLAMIRNALFGEETFYDLDKSKNIESYEAVLLGLALSADAAACGAALSATAFGNLWLPVLSGAMQGIFLWLGEILFEKGVKTRVAGQKGLGIFAGGLLILIALLRI